MQLQSGLFILLFACECGASKSDSSDTAASLEEVEEQDSAEDTGEEPEDSGQDTGAEQ